MVNKAYKFRMYPNKEQKNFFAKTFGCVRFIYNQMLSDKIAYYEEHKKMLKTTPAQYKAEYSWLKETDSLALANAQQNLNRAFTNFFTNPSCGFPNYKSRKSHRCSYTTNNQKGTIQLKDGKIKLPKVGWIKINYAIVCIESLDMKAIAKALHLGKSVCDNGWGMFTGFLQYKLEEEGKRLVKVNKFYASSQLCHGCGYKNTETKDLSVREWDCPVCKMHHNRDINAAKNILDEGLRLLSA